MIGMITASVVYKIHDVFPAPLCSAANAAAAAPHRRRKLDASAANKREIASFWYLALTTPTPSSLTWPKMIHREKYSVAQSLIHDILL